MNQNMINKEKLQNLSVELKETILMDISDIKKLYNDSDYDILKQELNEKKFDKETWLDWFALIMRGHYDFNKNRLDKKLKYFHKKTDLTEDETKILSDYSENRYKRISETMSTIDKILLLKIIKER